MNITILSLFRNACHYLERYFEQMDGLQRLLTQRGDALHLLLGYGDSIDGTGAALWDECVNRFDAHLLDVSHGGEAYPSVIDEQRFRQLAFVANKLAASIPVNSDAIAWIESDLIWRAETIMTMIDHLRDYPCVVPMVMHQNPSNRFYDRWAFVKDGVNFTNDPPYHAALNGEIVQLDSAGSCVVVRGELGRELRFPEKDVFRGWCHQLYSEGGSLWLDPHLEVEHP